MIPGLFPMLFFVLNHEPAIQQHTSHVLALTFSTVGVAVLA